MSKPKKNIPFDFVLENLFSVHPVTKPMFGAYAVYVNNKIVLLLRDKDDEDSGVWIASAIADHSSLKKEFPIMRSIKLAAAGVSGWQLLPKENDHFEENVLHACCLILKGDPRIGKQL